MGIPAYARLIGPEGRQIEVHAHCTGRVYWSSDWTRMDELTRSGWLVRAHGGPGTYGHVDYYLSRCGQ